MRDETTFPLQRVPVAGGSRQWPSNQPLRHITDEMVQIALEYLAQDPHPIGHAKYGVTKAENDKKILRAKLRERADGKTAADRDAYVECHPDFVMACEAEAKAHQGLEEERARSRYAETVIELARTEQANARAAERIR